MSAVNAASLLAAAGGEYEISRSVRLRRSASAYCGRTFSTNGTGGGITVTFSAWVKRGSLGVFQSIIGADSTSGTSAYLGFNSANCLEFGQGSSVYRVTSAVFRDPSAWYHIVLAWDASNLTDALRCRIYVNGVLQTYSTSASVTLNTVQSIGYARAQGIGADTPTTGARNFFDGYLAEVNFIDGQALTPASFGETDSLTGVWKPKKYAGTYGTNGFYLNFSDNSAATAAAIGKDSSGNGNNWTPNNISVTAGVTYDSMLDVPTMWADGGNGRGNYATFSPLTKYTNNDILLQDGNLTIAATVAGWRAVAAPFGMSSGKWYWEVTAYGSWSGSTEGMVGLFDDNELGYLVLSLDYPGRTPTTYGYYDGGQKYTNATATAYGSAWSANSVVGVAYDADAGSLTYYLNGTSQGVAFTGITGTKYPGISVGTNGTTVYANFGQRPFAYTPPTGFKALNTQNLPEATIKKGNAYFDVALHTGNGGTTNVTSLNFQPDLVWIKARSNAANHGIIDSVRGVAKQLSSSSTAAELDIADGMLSFNSNGFTVQNETDGYSLNTNGYTYADWCWKESAAAGFDIVAFTSQASGVGTFAHSLGVAPKMMIFKRRNAVSSWAVYHASRGAGGYLLLNGTGAYVSDANFLNNTAPSSTQFTLGSTYAGGGSFVAYLFAEVEGFSKFGSYTGNGSADGPFVYCGFRPRFILVKRTDSSTNGNWEMIDTARDAYNQAYLDLSANLSAVENATDGAAWDILSNGFKCRDGSSTGTKNVSGATYIYAAFAENPTKYSLAR